MNLDHLRYFAAIAQLQHYGKAAEQLHVSQPNLNYAVSQLETEEDAVVAGLVAAGFGIAVLPEDPLFRSLPLAVISLTDPDPARTAYLSRRRGTRLPEASRRFYEFCCRKLEEPAP